MGAPVVRATADEAAKEAVDKASRQLQEEQCVAQDMLVGILKRLMEAFGAHHEEVMAAMQTKAMTAATTDIVGHVARGLTVEGISSEVFEQERESLCAVGLSVPPLDAPPMNPGRWRLSTRPDPVDACILSGHSEK